MNNNLTILKVWLENNGFGKEASLLNSITKEGMRWEQKYTFEGADAKNMYIALEKLSVDDWRQILSILDPTGTLSIPDVPPAVAAFESNKSLFNSILLILAVLAIMPVVGKLARLGSKGLKTVVVALTKAKQVVPSNFASKADEAISFIDNLEDVSRAARPAEMTRSIANLVRQSLQKVKSMQLGTTTVLEEDLYVFLSARAGDIKVSSGFISPGVRSAGLSKQNRLYEDLLERFRPPGAVSRMDTVYVSPWSDAGAWSFFGPDIFLVRIPKGSKITYVDGEIVTEVAMNHGVAFGRTIMDEAPRVTHPNYLREAEDWARRYWEGDAAGLAGGEILTKARVEVLGLSDDILSQELISGSAAPSWRTAYDPL